MVKMTMIAVQFDLYFGDSADGDDDDDDCGGCWSVAQKLYEIGGRRIHYFFSTSLLQTVQRKTRKLFYVPVIEVLIVTWKW